MGGLARAAPSPILSTTVAVRFYRIANPNGDSFADALHAIASVPVEGRETNIGDSEAQPYLVRLEHLDDTDPPLIRGEFVRRVMHNNPPEATVSGLKQLALGEGSGLGYQVAFAYHPALRIIAIEHSPRSLALNRVLLYINMRQHSAFGQKVLVRKDAWAKYDEGSPRKMTLSIANPTNLPEVEGQVGSVVQATAKLREISNAPVITLQIGMGHRKGFLDNDFTRGVVKFFSEGQGQEQDVRKLTVRSAPLDGGPSEDIDFIDEILRHETTLDLTADPEQNYKIRRAFVGSKLREELPHFQAIYGDKT